MFSFYDMVKATTTTMGTGPATIGPAVAPYRAFSGVVADGARVRYLIVDAGGSAWERGWGVYTASTGVLTRNLECSSTGSLLNLSGSAVVDIVCGAPDIGSLARYRTTTYTANEGECVLADTSGGAWSLSLPASPVAGDAVEVKDATNSFGAHNLTVLGDGHNIDGVTYSGASSITLNAPGNDARFVFNGSTWKCSQVADGVWSAQTVSAVQSVTMAGLSGDSGVSYRLLASFSSAGNIDLRIVPDYWTVGAGL
jgi:hypothetical protein